MHTYLKLLFLIGSFLVVSCSPVVTSYNKITNTILQYKMKEALRMWEGNAIRQDTSYTDAFYEKFIHLSTMGFGIIMLFLMKWLQFLS